MSGGRLSGLVKGRQFFTKSGTTNVWREICYLGFLPVPNVQ
jgi:hypothetical protein